MAYIEIPKRHYTPTELSGMIGKHRHTIVRWCREGKLEGAHRTSGGHWRIPVDAVKGDDAPRVDRFGAEG